MIYTFDFTVYPEEAGGNLLCSGGSRNPIAGVMKDFHELSLRSPIEAVVFTGNDNRHD